MRGVRKPGRAPSFLKPILLQISPVPVAGMTEQFRGKRQSKVQRKVSLSLQGPGDKKLMARGQKKEKGEERGRGEGKGGGQGEGWAY